MGEGGLRNVLAKLPKVMAAVIALMTVGGGPPLIRYAAGQVWEYKTRPGDEGSLLKIQKIEDDPALAKLGPIYHISIIGFHFSNPRMQPIIPHAPVSRQTLDESVTRLSASDAAFPDATDGIAEWKRAHGGVFTISVAEIVTLIDGQTAQVGE